MATIRVVLDTSALRVDPSLAGAGFEALARYAEEGYVQVIVPRVVVSEFTTSPSAKIESLSALRKTLKELLRNSPDKLHEAISKFEESIAAEFDAMEKAAQAALDNWMARTGATIEETRPDHTERVLRRYFNGQPPFRSVKSREDFPDAFIYECVSDLAATTRVLVVVRDKGLAGALAATKNVSVFPTMRELLESAEFDDLRTEVEAANVERAVDALRLDKHLFLHVVDEAAVGLIAGKFVDDPSTYVDDDHEADELYIEMVGPVVEWEVGDEHEYLGEGVIFVTFRAIVEVTVETSTGGEFNDLHGAPSDRRVEIEGALSLQMDAKELKTPSSDWSGVKLGNVAQLHVDELHDMQLLGE